MPAALPAGYVPKADAQVGKTYRMRMVQYADGYAQRSGIGINTVQEEWQLTFAGLSQTAGDTLEAFFDARAGVDAVLWQPPNAAAALKWLASNFRRSYGSGVLMSDITVTFRRLYE